MSPSRRKQPHKMANKSFECMLFSSRHCLSRGKLRLKWIKMDFWQAFVDWSDVHFGYIISSLIPFATCNGTNNPMTAFKISFYCYFVCVCHQRLRLGWFLFVCFFLWFMLCTNILNHLRHSQARYQFVTVDCLHLVKFIEGLATLRINFGFREFIWASGESSSFMVSKQNPKLKNK